MLKLILMAVQVVMEIVRALIERRKVPPVSDILGAPTDKSLTEQAVLDGYAAAAEKFGPRPKNKPQP